MACGSGDSDAINRLPIPGLPEGEWQTITGDPNAPVEVTEAPELSQAEAIAVTEKLAMPEDRFWRLIDVMDGAATEESVAQLAQRLATVDEQELISFQAQLTLQLFSLDTWDAAQRYVETSGYGGDDGFLYTRCATVGAGRAATERAVDTSTVVIDESGEGEYLLYVGYDAAEAKGLGWEIFDVIPLSPETGNNEEGWADYDPEVASSL